MSDFCVYIHRRNHDGTAFYVGKGLKYRPYQKSGRSSWWHRIVNKYGYTVEIVIENLQEWAAFEIEKDLIAYYGRMDLGDGGLCNLSDGGEGASGCVPTKERLAQLSAQSSGLGNPKADRNVYTFFNTVTKEEITTTRYDFEKQYGIKVGSLFKRNLTAKNWCLKINLDKVENKNYFHDKTVYNFLHIDGDSFSGTMSAFRRKYRIEPKHLIYGKINFAKGWYLDNGVEKQTKEDRNVYTLYNSSTGEVFEGTRKDFKVKYNLAVDRLFCNNPSESSFGWSLRELPKRRKTFDKTIYRFFNEDKEYLFIGTRTDFNNKYDFCCDSLFRKDKSVQSKSYRGWYVLGDHATYRFFLYTLYHKESGVLFDGKRSVFTEKYPEVCQQVFAESCKTTYLGWKVIEKRQYTPYNTCISFDSVL